MIRMEIIIKDAHAIAGMREACRLGSEVLDMLAPHIKAGITTSEINQLAHDYMVNVQGSIPATLNYEIPGHPPYPASLCTSVNDVVVHGIPDSRALREGDIVNVDVTVIKDGWHGDNSRMFIIGEASEEAQRLCTVAFEAMWLGILEVKPGAHFGDIGHAIASYTESHGYSVVREFCGHGVGAKFHEPPLVYHFGPRGARQEMRPGMIFTIEPMINAGGPGIMRAQQGDHYDGWTIVTQDGSLSAQWEHTVLVTETGYEVLTLSAGSPPQPGFVPA